MFQDFPGGPVAKNLTASTGDTGSISGPGRYPMPQGTWSWEPQLLKPALLEPRLRNKRRHQNEKPHALQLESSPRSHLETAWDSSEDPAQPEIKK